MSSSARGEGWGGGERGRGLGRAACAASLIAAEWNFIPPRCNRHVSLCSACMSDEDIWPKAVHCIRVTHSEYGRRRDQRRGRGAGERGKGGGRGGVQGEEGVEEVSVQARDILVSQSRLCR